MTDQANIDDEISQIKADMQSIVFIYNHLKERLQRLERLHRIERQSENQTEPTNSPERTDSPDAKWMNWPSVKKVLEAEDGLTYGQLSSSLNHVWWSMSSQSYPKEAGLKFLEEVRKTGRFNEADLMRASAYIAKYWPDK